jgi:DNA-binding NarL/FixJ family response regulator
MSAIDIVLADDHPIVLDGLEQLFRFEPSLRIVARCRSGEEAVRAVRELRPRILVLDVRMPGIGGLEVLAAIAREKLPTRVVLLAAALDDAQLAASIRLGARGIVLKEMAPQLLLDAVREVAGGGRWLDPGMVDRVLGGIAAGGSAGESPRLTPRESEIVRMVASGLRNRDIAERLVIGEGTVKMHLHNIYEKLDVGGRVELTLRAQKLGLA